MPLTEEQIAAIQAERDKASGNYWTAAPGATSETAIDLDGPAAGYYQPNPGAAGYSPNPGAATAVAPPVAPAPPVLGAQPPPPLSPTTNAFKTGAALSTEVANAPPPAVGGPTAADNAAFAAKSASLAAPRPAGAGGLGAGGPVNRDPFGIGAANKALLGSFDEQRAAKEREGNAVADRAFLEGEHKARIARMQEDDATIAKLENDEATRRFDGHMQEMQKQLDDVRSKKVDPQKYMNDRAGYGFLAVLGGLVGGLYQGLNKLDHNPFLVELNGQIDRQMQADERNIANERAAVGEQMNLLSMNRVVYKDKHLADMQTRAMYLEAAKSEAEAQMAGTDSEIAKARAAQGLALIDHEKGMLQKQLAETARAQSAAGAAAMYARQKERQGTFKEIYAKAIGEGISPERAEYEASRVTALLYAPQALADLGPRPAAGADDGMTVRDRSHLQRERVSAQEESRAELAALRDWKKRIPELAEGSAVGEYWSGAPGILPGVQTAKQNKLKRESYNATVARAYDAAMKSAQGSAPTESQKAQLKVYYLDPNDDDSTIAKKIGAAEEFVVQAGRAKGLKESTPNETAKALGEKPLK